jgi:hypothetical protein
VGVCSTLDDECLPLPAGVEPEGGGNATRILASQRLGGRGMESQKREVLGKGEIVSVILATGEQWGTWDLMAVWLGSQPGSKIWQRKECRCLAPRSGRRGNQVAVEQLGPQLLTSEGDHPHGEHHEHTLLLAPRLDFRFPQFSPTKPRESGKRSLASFSSQKKPPGLYISFARSSLL